MYNTLKGPTKQNRVIRTPNIIKLTESGVVCIAYSYCHSILPSKRHSLTLWMLGYSHFTLPSHIFHSISVDRLSASLRNSPFTSLSLSLCPSIHLTNMWLSAIRTHVQYESMHVLTHHKAPWYFFANKRFVLTSSIHISKYTYENPEFEWQGKFSFEFRALTCIPFNALSKSWHHSSIYTQSVHSLPLYKLRVLASLLPDNLAEQYLGKWECIPPSIVYTRRERERERIRSRFVKIVYALMLCSLQLDSMFELSDELHVYQHTVSPLKHDA